MDIYSPVVKHILYPLWVLKNKSSLLKHLDELEKTQYYSLEKIRNLQWRRLVHLLKHAYENCPFYRKRFLEVGLKPSHIHSPDDLLKIPPLTKNDIQENLSEIIAKNFRKNDLIRDVTGGSTGHPLVFYYSKEREDSRNAAQIRHSRWSFWDIGDKAAYIWQTHRDTSSLKGLKAQFRDLLLRRSGPTLNTHALNEKDMYLFAKKLMKFRPKVILGYAQATAFFAKFLEAHKTLNIHPSAIVTSAEVLFPKDRELIENVFNCKVFNRYGCREVGLIANECEMHQGLHINAENLYLEFIREGKPVIEASGEILVTDLRNYAMPFIRYKIGDVGRLLKGTCPCGRGMPIMDNLEGRISDFIITPDQRVLSGLLFIPLLKEVEGVKQMQLIQEEIDQLRVKIVKGNNFTQNSTERFLNNISKLFGERVSVEIQYVSHIPREVSGKYRYTISKVSPRIFAR